MLTMNDFRKGDRVQLHPGTDLWMMGARFAGVEGVGRRFLTIRLDATGRQLRISPHDILEVIETAPTLGM